MVEKNKEMTETVDHEARSSAALALQKIESHERFCEERARKAEIFEAEVRVGIRDMANSFDKGLTRIHERLDAFQRVVIGVALTALATGVGGIFWFLADKQ